MADKLEGTAIIANTVSGDRIVTGSITTTQLAPSIASFVNAGQPLKIRTITYPGNDTAANTGGGQTIVLTGTGFGQNVQVYINSNAVPSVTRTNANSISFTTPALAAATYPIYVINTDDGATAILIPGIQYSGTPTWTTTTPLTTQAASIAWNIQLEATSDSTISYSLQAGSSLPAGITLAANGLISGTMSSPPADETTYNFTVVANDLENQDASRAFSVSVTVAVLDPFFTYTTLLLHGDGTNNANNHAFVDSSNNNFTITKNGNATQGTFSPFGDNWSYYFDGTTDYLSSAYSSTNFNWWGTDFTVEAWINPDTLTGWTVVAGDATQTQPALVGNMTPNSATANYWSFGPTAEGRLQFYYYNGSPIYSAISNGRIQAGVWSHIAMTKTSSGITFYINGIKDATVAISGTPQESASYPLTIGSWSSANIKGYVSNLRIIKGTALYTTNFTPSSTPIGVIANTTYLTAQSNRFEDRGPQRLAITRTGDVRVSKFDPFKPYKAIPASYGVYFDGTGDYLSIADNTALDMGSSNFTIEGWYFPIGSASSSTAILAKRANSSTVGGVLLYYGGNGLTPSLLVDIGGGWAINQSSSVSFVANQWNHFAIVRNGSAFNLYINGVSGVSATNAGAIPDNSAAFTIGAMGADGSGPISPCHISNFRVVKGTAVYTTAFTPPTSPLTAVANTSLLTCQSTTIIDNSTNAFTITRNGDARPTDLNPFTTVFVSEKYNTANSGGSLYSDGSGDYLTAPTGSVNNIGTNDYTIEGWFWANSFSTDGYYRRLWSFGSSINDSLSLHIDDGTISAAGRLIVRFNDTIRITSSSSVVLGTWNHISLVRNSTTTTLYLNGISVGTHSNNDNLTTAGGGTLSIAAAVGSSSGVWSGYISSFRVVKNTAVYTTTFTPPTAPVTNIANTSLLANFTNAGIIDSVGKNVLETVGDTRVNTSIKKFGSGSMYFDGTGDYLRMPYNSDLQMRTADYTFECWVYMTSAPADFGLLYNTRNNNSQFSPFQVYVRNSRVVELYISTSGSSWTAVVTSSLTVPLNSWTHIAVTRASGIFRIFIDGILDTSSGATATVTGSLYEDTGWGSNIGAENISGSAGNAFTGYIDELRITKGVARYRYSFTPPTKAFNDGNGNLATLTSDVLVGDQVNTPAFPYTTLLLHGDGTNNANNHAFVDSSNNNFAITRNGNATQGTFSPFSPTGWSNFFDGTSDVLTLASNAAFSPGTGDFTLEAWIYPTSLSATFVPFLVVENTGGLWIGKNSSNFVVRAYGVADQLQVPILPQLNQWTHIAVSRSGTTLRMFFNGALVGSTTNSYNFASGVACIGSDASSGSGGASYFPGYISNLRLIKGSALYTSNFTPSTSALTAVANTSLLTCQSNRFIDNSTNAFSITRVGDVSIQAFSPFAPSVEYAANTHGGSAYFDGTGDYLLSGGSSVLNLSTGDWTIQGWYYPTAYSVNNNVIAYVGQSAGDKIVIADISTGGSGLWYLLNGSAAITSSTKAPLNAWSFFALVKSGSTTTLYLNGVSLGTTTSAPTSSNKSLNLGSDAGAAPFQGYMADFRILNGTANTAIPTAPLTAINNTALLLNFTNAGILDSTGDNTFETVGDAKVNTAIKKYGAGSMVFDGTGDYLAIPASPGLTFGTGDFTIEMWVYAGNQGSTGSRMMGNGAGAGWGTGKWILTTYSTDGYKYQFNWWNYSSGTSGALIGTSATNTSTWNHLAITRSGNTFRMFVNGILESTVTSSTSVDNGTPAQIRVGSGGISGDADWAGYIDDLRVTKGVARYITNFTPPTAAFLNK